MTPSRVQPYSRNLFLCHVLRLRYCQLCWYLIWQRSKTCYLFTSIEVYTAELIYCFLALDERNAEVIANCPSMECDITIIHEGFYYLVLIWCQQKYTVRTKEDNHINLETNSRSKSITHICTSVLKKHVTCWSHKRIQQYSF